MLQGACIAALNHLLDSAPWARARLRPHAGDRAHMRVGAVTLDFSISAQGYLAECLSEEEPQVRIEMPWPGPAELSEGIEGAMRKARIEGEVELADTLGFVFRNLHWDREGDLAKLVGDVLAHRLHRSGESAWQAARGVAASVQDNLREFVAEGHTPLVRRTGMDGHSDALRAMRDDLARLEKRIERLEKAALRPA